MQRRIYNTPVPNPEKIILERHHLNEKIHKGIQNSLVIVTGDTGYGKTEAVSSYLDQVDINVHVVWIQLNKLDNVPSHFWESFIHSFSLQNPDASNKFKKLEFPDTIIRLDNYLNLLASYVFKSKKFILVFDDLHIIHERSVLWIIENIVNSQIENLCTILLTRSIPAFQIDETLLNEKTTLITKDDLKFTYDETIEYIKELGMDPGTYPLKQFYNYTEGWPLAIHLTAFSFKAAPKTNDELVMDNSLALIFQIIEQQVFSNFKPIVQKFLAKLALTNNFDKEFIDMITGDLDGIMPFLSQTNMFITHNPHDSSYHMHNLFARFVKKKKILSEKEETDTYNLLGSWYEKKHLYIDAIISYFNSKNYGKCWTLIEHQGTRHCSKEKAEFLLKQIDRIPDEYKGYLHIAELIKANLLINNNRLADCEKLLDKLYTELIRKSSKSQEDRECLGNIYILKGMLSFCSRRLDIAENLRKAYEYLPEGSDHFFYSPKLIDSNYAAIMDSPRPGELRKMQDVLFEAIPFTSKLMGDAAYGRAYLCKAEGSYYTGDFENSKEYAIRAIYRGKQRKNPSVVCMAYFILLKTVYAEGNFDAVTETLKDLEDFAVEYEKTSLDHQIYLDITKGWLFSKLGLYDQIPRWVVDEKLNAEILPPISIGRDRIIQGHYMLYQEKYQEVISFLQKSDYLFYQNKTWFALLASKIIQAIACYYIHDEESAAVYLLDAYKTAIGNGLHMAFIEYGNHMRNLITGLSSLTDLEIPEDWLNMILTKSKAYAKTSYKIKEKYYKSKEFQSSNIFNLTNNELYILQDLCEGMSRDEVSKKHNLETELLKRNLQKIYQKLGVYNQTDAIKAAISTNLIMQE